MFQWLLCFYLCYMAKMAKMYLVPVRLRANALNLIVNLKSGRMGPGNFSCPQECHVSKTPDWSWS